MKYRLMITIIPVSSNHINVSIGSRQTLCCSHMDMKEGLTEAKLAPFPLSYGPLGQTHYVQLL